MKQSIVIGIVILCSLLGAVGQLFFFKASKTLSFNIIEIIKNYNLIIGIALYGIATIGYIAMLKHGQLSTLYPLIAFSYIFVVILSAQFLREPVTLPKLIGSLGIVLCVAVINYKW